MKLKLGVRILGIKPELLLGIQIVEAFFVSMGKECWITAGVDGSHSRASLHFAGQAVDFRSHDLDEEGKDFLLANLPAALGEDFDLILENRGQDTEHVHLEYQPKEKLG